MKLISVYFLIFIAFIVVLPIIFALLWLALILLWLARGWRIMRWFISKRQELNSVRQNFGMIRSMIGF